METIEALDREVIIERAEAVRLWLLGLHLSSRATGAIQRELGAIIDNDPGTYINGQRPLAGLTIAEFITELHRPNGGAVARVKSVGYAALNELRSRIWEDTRATAPEPQPEPEYTVPELDAPVVVVEVAQQDEPPPILVDEAKPRRGRPRRVAAPMAAGLMSVPIAAVAVAAPERVAPIAEASQAEGTSEVQPTRRGPGRPKGSTKAKQNGGATSHATDTAIVAQSSADELPAPVEPVIAAEPITAEPITAELPATAEPKLRRGPGRPKGSTKAAQNGLVVNQDAAIPEATPSELPATAEPKPRRGRPRREAASPIVVASLPDDPTTNRSVIIASAAPDLAPAPAEDRIAPVTHDGDDPMLSQLTRLWSALHPHARRAVVMYASTLWAETAADEG